MMYKVSGFFLILYLFVSCNIVYPSTKHIVRLQADTIITDTCVLENEIVLERKEAINYWQSIPIITSIVLITALVLVIGRTKKNKRDLSELIESLELAKESNRTSSKAIAELIEDRSNLVRTLIGYDDLASGMEKNLSVLEYVEKLQTINDGYRKTIEAFRKDVSYFSKLERALDAGKNGVISRCRLVFGNAFSEKDYQIISCFYAGMSPVSISFLTGVKSGTIRVKKSRFVDRIQSLEDSENKSVLLKEIK